MSLQSTGTHRPEPDAPAQASSFLGYLEAKKQSTGGCPDLSDLLGYVNGRLSRERQQQVREHLVVCAACSAQVLKIAKAPPKRNPPFASVVALVLILGLSVTVAVLWPERHRADSDFARLEPVGRIARNAVPVHRLSRDPNKPLFIQLNTDDLEDHTTYRIELLQGDPPRVAWQETGLARQPDRSFMINLPRRYSQGVLHLRLLGDDRIIAEYQLHLMDP
ncbi:anti-sigma factor family protein [Acanthopleuribacter pedis]|uniref:Zf-HC2 domain-containing protein n=1 Tax=Acanthopleuribacter pedis TaxID=442870 RepID=A0A8J7U5Q5_9BACT|nr:zf-HC2 domain-containing protein [Acanthopleuribacter pedis]MBO1321962.1 zf-HC2 domain-containing protein [Acanthopleuribacter pedis]